jgi:hypothetical protein
VIFTKYFKLFRGHAFLYVVAAIGKCATVEPAQDFGAGFVEISRNCEEWKEKTDFQTATNFCGQVLRYINCSNFDFNM